MARKISVEIVGDASSLQRSFQRSGASAKVFERDISKAGRGAAAASLSFHGLGRALSFASGYFLASGGIIYALKAATKAGIEHQAQTAQLAAAVTHAGVSYKAYGTQIQETLRKQRDLAGFSENETDASFTKLLRTTKSISAATRDNALAMEIARGAGIDLNSASNIVNKTLAGQTTGLRRLGVELPKGISGYRALQIAGAKYAGSVTAFTNTAAGAQARLTNALHETEITIGTALLPTITKYSTELANWLDKSSTQKKIQHDVNEVMRDASTIVKDLTAAVRLLNGPLGGFKTVLEELIALKVFLWARNAQVGLAGMGASAVAAEGEVATLRASLVGLGALAIAPIVIPVIVKYDDKLRSKGFFGKLLSDAAIPSQAVTDVGGFIVRQITKPGKDSYVNKPGFGQGVSAGGAGAEAAAKAAAGRARSAVAATTAASGGTSSAAAPLDRLSQIQDQVAQARLAVAQKQKGSTAKLVAALKAEIDYDAKYAAIQEKLAKQGGKNAKKHSQTAQALLASETADLNEITSLTAKHAAAAKKKKKAAKAAAAFTVPLGLQLAAAQAGATSGTRDDLSAAEAIRAYARKVIRSGKATLQTQIDAWNEIAAQNATIAGILGNVGKQTQHSVVESSAQFVKGLHFASLADKQAAEARFAQAQAHGGRVPNVIGAAGQPISLNGDVILDGQKVGSLITGRQQRDARHAAVQTRGPQAGRNARVH